MQHFKNTAPPLSLFGDGAGVHTFIKFLRQVSWRLGCTRLVPLSSGEPYVKVFDGVLLFLGSLDRHELVEGAEAELLNLMWRDIDFETKTARVAAKRSGVFTAPDGSELPILEWSSKAYEDRMVPLPETTITILTKMLAANDGSPYVFLPIERLHQIAAEMGDGPLGANYELVNNRQELRPASTLRSPVPCQRA